MTDEQSQDLAVLRAALASKTDPIVTADWTLPVPEGLQENPSFVNEMLQKVDAFSDTLDQTLMEVIQMRSEYKEYRTSAKALFDNALKRKMIELALDPNQTKRLSQELLGYLAEQSLVREKGDLDFADACMEAFKDANDILEVRRKHLSHKRNDLLGMVGALRSSTFLHKGPGNRYAVDLRTGPQQF